MPRSPTMIICSRPKSIPDHLHDLGERGRVAGVPLEDADRDGAALGVGEQPVLDLQLAFLAVAGVAAGRKRAAPALHPRATTGRTAPSATGSAPGPGAGRPAPPRSGPAGARASPSPRRCRRWTRRQRPGRRRGWCRPTRSAWTAWRPGATTREMIRASARSRWRPAGPSRAGSPSRAAIACTAATWPCGSDPVMVTASPAGTICLALEPGVDQVDDVVRQRGQVGDGLVLDLAAVAVGAPQVGRGVVPAAALLVHVPGLGDFDYVDLPASSRHTPIIPAFLHGTR